MSESDEFNNFMVRVNEISKIVSNLTATDKARNEIGAHQADEYLKYKDIDSTIIDEDVIVTKTKYDKTLINKNTAPEINPAEMSQEVFKRTVEIDVKKRTEDRLKRKEQADTFKRRGNNAFRQGDFPKALQCYTEALTIVKDSPLLYLNRALTYINLKMYDKCVTDCKTALKLDEDSLKAWLYLGKSYLYLNEKKKFEHAVKNARKFHPEHANYITEYVEEVRRNFDSENKEEFEIVGDLV